VFDPGSLAPGVIVDQAGYRVWAFDAGIKCRGIFASPVGSVSGFYVGGQKGPTVPVATSFYF
jgi:hypothetical protein